MEILDKLETLKNRHEEIADQMSDPDVMSDMKKFVKLNKEYRDLEKIVGARSEYVKVLNYIKINYIKIMFTVKQNECIK